MTTSHIASAVVWVPNGSILVEWQINVPHTFAQEFHSVLCEQSHRGLVLMLTSLSTWYTEICFRHRRAARCCEYDWPSMSKPSHTVVGQYSGTMATTRVSDSFHDNHLMIDRSTLPNDCDCRSEFSFRAGG